MLLKPGDRVTEYREFDLGGLRVKLTSTRICDPEAVARAEQIEIAALLTNLPQIMARYKARLEKESA